MTVDRTRFHSTKSSESRSKKTPVTGLFEDHHHEQIFRFAFAEIAFLLRFRVDGKRGALPKALSTREKAGYPDTMIQRDRTVAEMDRS